jgi:hypothetical protein
MIDRHYGHLARDSHVHAVSLLDALAFERAVDAGWTLNRSRANALIKGDSEPYRSGLTGAWTLGGRQGSFLSPCGQRKELISRKFLKPSNGLEPLTPSLPSEKGTADKRGSARPRKSLRPKGSAEDR